MTPFTDIITPLLPFRLIQYTPKWNIQNLIQREVVISKLLSEAVDHVDFGIFR